MTRYAVFLRGVNVGGIKVTTKELRDLLFSLGFDDARTYLQTGNITLSSGQSVPELTTLLEQALSARFGYDARVMIYGHADLQTIVDDYPFPAGADLHRYVVLVSDEAILPELFATANQLDADVERIALGPGVLYWQLPKGKSLDTAFAKIMTKAKVKRVTTTRNLNTLEKMVNA
jgi:uncharacterized protein (DUF1697 family)